MASSDVARRRAMIVRYPTIAGISSRFLNIIKNLQDVVRGSKMAATSYNVGRLRTNMSRHVRGRGVKIRRKLVISGKNVENWQTVPNMMKI